MGPVVVTETVARAALGMGPTVFKSVDEEHVVDYTWFWFTRSDLVALEDIVIEELSSLSA